MHITQLNEPRTRTRVITIRHTTPSRSRIEILVIQSQDAMHKWMTPLITYDGPSLAFMESGEFAHDIGIGLLVAAYFYDEFMLDVEKDSQSNNTP